MAGATPNSSATNVAISEKLEQSSSPIFVYSAIVALLIWYFVTAVTATLGKSTMFDELFHLTGGYTYWKTGDFRIQPENGNLPQRWDAIPLLFYRPNLPKMDNDVWRRSALGAVGVDFFYHVGNDCDAMLLRGRAMNALFGVALGTLVFTCARRLMGTGAAFVSLVLFALCPTMLANGAVISSDMAAALFYFASILALWRVVQVVSWRTLLVSTLAMSGLFVAKFGAFMIIPMGVVLIAVQLVSRQPIVVQWRKRSWQIEGRATRLFTQLALVSVHAIVVWCAIWAFYNFRFDMFASTTLQPNEAGEQVVVDQPSVAWDVVLGEHDLLQRFIEKARALRFLPEAYLYGFANTWHFGKARACFLNGSIGSKGWWYFFPYSVLVKTPLALFVLTALSAAWVLHSWRSQCDWQTRWEAIGRSLYRTAPLWTLFVVYWGFAVTSHLNIGHRHILPTYPVMLVFAGGSWFWLGRKGDEVQEAEESSSPSSDFVARLQTWFAARRWPVATLVVIVCLSSFAGESLWSWPNYWTYFNVIAGGPLYAYRHLVDSSLDWGQDLPALKKWLAEAGLDNSTPETKVYLSYFGTASPDYYGIHADRLICYFNWDPPSLPAPLQSGAYCVSATMLQSVYGDFPGHWSKEYEAMFRELTNNVNLYLTSDQKGQLELVSKTGKPFWFQQFASYQYARNTRLTSYLREREPDFEVNNTILVYYLSANDVKNAMDEPLPEMDEPPKVAR
jgi:4-amino-4-deoxy-L-arabinose transferase-like glycosyltransferase